MTTAFRLGMIVKGVDSVFEVIGGLILTTPTKLARYLLVLSQHEAYRHHPVLAGRIDHLAQTVTMHPSIGEAVYLVVHGLAKIVLIVAIIRGLRWGYVGFMAILGLFAAIEVARAFTAGEVVTGCLGLFDLALVVLIYREFRAKFSNSAAPEGN